MDNIIARATNSINQMLEMMSEYEDTSSSPLIETCTLLNRLLEPDSLRNEWVRLFCRQLNRLMDYNGLLSEDFWIDLRDDISYLIEKQNDTQNIDNIRNRLLKSINLEEKLVQRELKFEETFGKRKSLSQLFCDHQTFFEEYLQKCILLHSKVQIQGLVKDLDGFLRDRCDLTEILSIEKKYLNEKLNCIKIPLDCSNRLLGSLQSHLFEYVNPQYQVNQKLANFIPSAESRFNKHSYSKLFVKVLGSERWLVILGDSGSAKTSLLRWITSVFAETAYNRHEEIVLEENNPYVVRIPILIRIGEFALWLEQHQNKTLMDYVGKHTWFSQTYTYNDNGIVLRELIDHGHALILIDGLDEIPEIARRKEIIDLVQEFIVEHVNASDFISASDSPIFNDSSKYYYKEVIETQSPHISGGNQVIVTSRIVGYHLYSLNNPVIHHCSLSLMNHQEANEFVKKWMIQVEKGILDVLMNERIKIDERRVEIISSRRENTVKTMFENSSKLLMSNPSLLSLICAFIFESSDKIEFKSRIEIYNHAVQAAFGEQKCKESNISETLLNNFLINLATYLHLQSPSGLIDAFDMEHLGYLTLRQQNFVNSRQKLRENVKQMITFITSNNGIVDERGLQIFGFLHLSFQEYFVTQSFVRVSSIEEVAKRILTFVINPRFRESLLMALGWISWKWSFTDFNQFCNSLVTSNSNYAIPFGALLFFDAISDMQRLPSNSVIFTTFVILLDHPNNIIAETYFISNFLKFPKDIIIEWMQLYLKDGQRLSKFCKCLRIKFSQSSDVHEIDSKSTAPLIYQQLRSFYNVSTSSAFIIDQTFRSIYKSEDASMDILNNELGSYFSSHNISPSNFHPLVLSVIIAVYGGIRFDSEEYEVKIHFSTKHMHHESSITSSIVEYFANNKESHSTKIQILIKEYESILQKASLSDTSIDIVDTFIALVCLKGLSEPSIYQKYDGYQALPLVFTRLKRTWFYLKKPFDPVYVKHYGNVDTSSIITSDVESIIKTFVSQTALSDEERLSFSFACAAALNKLCTDWSSDSFKFDVFLSNNFSRCLGCQPEFNHSVRSIQNQITNNSYSMQMFRHEPYFLLTFVPQSLQKLYCCMIINVANKTDSLPFVIFLSQCLILLEDINDYNPNFDLALSTLELQFKEHRLENYALTLSHKCFTYQLEDYDILINIERQRIFHLKSVLERQEKDLQLFAASISLARLFRSRENKSTKRKILSIVESEEVHSAVMNILDSILRIIALSIILDMKNPLIFDEEQRDELRSEMIRLLQSVLSSLPLQTSVLLFIRCYTARQVFPIPFQQMADIIGKKLNEMPSNGDSQAQEAAFIALQQLNNSDLSHHLSKFVKHTTMNLSDLLQFNSSIFFRYLTNTTHSIENSILLSIIYLTELTFDAQSLNMNSTDNHKDEIISLKQWKLLWNDASTDPKRMTFKMAVWITNYLEKSNKIEIHEIIEDVSQCLMIERRAQSIIEKWLCYKMDKCLKFFTHYAALQLFIEGSNVPNLIDIIIEIFDTDKQFRFRSLVKHLFKSEIIDSTALRQLLIILNQNVHYSSTISTQIDRKEILTLIFNLELEHTNLNNHESSEYVTNPFLSMINGISHDLQLYLLEHLHTLIDEQSEVQNTSKEKYIALLVKWIIKNNVSNDERGNFSQKLYEYILILLHDQRSPRIQKATLNGLNSLFKQDHRTSKERFSLEVDIITNLEKIILSYGNHSKDVLAICLLAYGNCLLKLKRFQMNYDLSNEIQNVFTNLFETSLSETISIRAAFCLIIAEQSSITVNAISNWFTNKRNSTPEDKYNVLLQKTLYRYKDDSFIGNGDAKEIVDHIETHSAELLDKFVLELYDYLYNQCGSNYLSDPVPNYFNIAVKVSERNFNIFHNAARKSWFGEEKFKRQLYLYYTKRPRHSKAIVNLYATFGVLTVELVEMLTWIEDNSIGTMYDCLKVIRQVSDQEVIEELFEQLDLNVYNANLDFFSSILTALVQLAQAHIVSSLEIHERLSFIFNNRSHDDNFKNWYGFHHITNSLLKLSCIETNNSPIFERKLLSENDIDEEFKQTVQIQEKKSTLFLRRNYFFSIIQSISK